MDEAHSILTSKNFLRFVIEDQEDNDFLSILFLIVTLPSTMRAKFENLLLS